jgi:hypothetical protein
MFSSKIESPNFKIFAALFRHPTEVIHIYKYVIYMAL